MVTVRKPATGLTLAIGLASLLFAQTSATDKKSTTSPKANTSGAAKKTTPIQASKPVVHSLTPTIDDGVFNEALISTKTVDGKDWLVFSLKKGSEKLYYGRIWILPASSSGGEWTNSRGDQYYYSADGLYMGANLKLLPGAVAIDNDNTGYTGLLDHNGSEYGFAGTVNLLNVTFSSDDKEPLVFKLVKDVGAVYISGKGTVTGEDGKELLRIPPVGYSQGRSAR